MAEPEVAKPYAYFLPVVSEPKKDSSSSERTMAKKKKKQGTGNPFQRGETWTYIIYVPDPQTGKKKQKWVGGFESKEEAVNALARARIEIAEGRVSTWGDLPFEEYVEKYLENVKPQLKPTSYNQLRGVLYRYMQPFQSKKIGKITLHDIENLERYMQKINLKPVTRKGVHVNFGSVFTWAVRHEDIPKSPYINFRAERVKPREPTTPTAEEIVRILTAAQGTMLYVPIVLALSLGLRRGEILGLKFSDFDHENLTVRIVRQITGGNDTETHTSAIYLQTPKTLTSERIVPVPEEIMDMVDQIQSERNTDKDDWVVALKNHESYNPNSFAQRYCRFKKKLGLKCRFHDLRHAYAQTCMEKGVPPKIIANALGHRNVDTTLLVYCDSKEINRNTANVMGEFVQEVLANVISKDPD